MLRAQGAAVKASCLLITWMVSGGMQDAVAMGFNPANISVVASQVLPAVETNYAVVVSDEINVNLAATANANATGVNDTIINISSLVVDMGAVNNVSLVLLNETTGVDMDINATSQAAMGTDSTNASFSVSSWESLNTSSSELESFHNATDRFFNASETTTSLEDLYIVEAPVVHNWTCHDNLLDYTVRLDIQLGFGDKNVISVCGSEEEADIATSVTGALHGAFRSRVPNWSGDAFFGNFGLDTSQQVNVRKKQLRQRTEKSFLSGDTALSYKCPQRDIDCHTDFCLWGCLKVSTSDCGISSLVNWIRLEHDVKSSLRKLGIKCLGISSALEINLTIDDASNS